MMIGRECVLFSGGMDSFLAWKLFAPTADLVFIDIGQVYLAKEVDAARAVTLAEGVRFRILHATQIASGNDTTHGIILHRNALLILTAATYYNRILLGVLADEINSDKSPEFFLAMKKVLDISHRGQYWNDGVGVTYEISSPIRDFTKTDLVARYLAAGFDPDTLLKTVSCYNGLTAQGHCGECPSCFKRWVALINNNLSQLFRSPPVEWAERTGILRKASDGTYGPLRTAEIQRALSKYHWGS